MDKIKSMYDLPTMKPIDISKVLDKLNKVILEEKSYEVSNVDGYKFVFITGYNEDERDLPSWDHPILREGVRNEKIIVTDVRRFLNKVDEKPVFLADVVKDKSGLLFMINRTIVHALLDSGNLGLFKQVQNSIASLFASVVVVNISMYLDLNPKEKLLIETVSAMYVHNMFLNNYSVDERLSVIKARVLNTKLSLPSLNKKELDDIVLSINLTANTFKDLVTNIQNAVPGKKEILKEEAIYSALNSLWYGPGNVSTALVHLEDLSTMIVLYYTGLEDGTYKRTRLASLIANSKRRIDDKALSSLSLVLKQYVEL